MPLQEVAQKRGVSLRTVEDWIFRGGLQAHVITWYAGRNRVRRRKAYVDPEGLEDFDRKRLGLPPKLLPPPERGKIDAIEYLQRQALRWTYELECLAQQAIKQGRPRRAAAIYRTLAMAALVAQGKPQRLTAARRHRESETC